MKNKKLLKIYHKLYKAFGPQHWWPGDTPFEVAVGAILTQNTNWGNVEKAINNLKREKVLSAKAIHDMPLKKLASFIQPSGYFNVKAKRLKSFINFLMNDYHGSMQKMRKDGLNELRHKLLSVNGIGPETADSILLYALDKPVFVIDAYTKRVLSRHKILAHDEYYEKYQELFHLSLTKDVKLFNEYHALFVRVGKEFCKPKPKCEMCPLKERVQGFSPQRVACGDKGSSKIMRYDTFKNIHISELLQPQKQAVIPHLMRNPGFYMFWIPAFAGMTIHIQSRMALIKSLEDKT